MAVDEFNSFRYESIISYFQVISKAYITSKANSRKHTKKEGNTKKILCKFQNISATSVNIYWNFLSKYHRSQSEAHFSNTIQITLLLAFQQTKISDPANTLQSFLLAQWFILKYLRKV